MALCPHCNKKIDKEHTLIQETKEDYWLCNCGDYHKNVFPYECPLKVLRRRRAATDPRKS